MDLKEFPFAKNDQPRNYGKPEAKSMFKSKAKVVENNQTNANPRIFPFILGGISNCELVHLRNMQAQQLNGFNA